MKETTKLLILSSKARRLAVPVCGLDYQQYASILRDNRKWYGARIYNQMVINSAKKFELAKVFA